MLNEREKKKLEIIRDNTLNYKQKVEKVKNEKLYDEYSLDYFSGEGKGCVLCDYKGYYYDEKEVYHECECRKIVRHEKMVDDAMIPKIYKELRLKDIINVYSSNKDQERFEKIKKGLEKTLKEIDDCIKEGYGVGIWSKERGSGKTMIMSAFANELLDKGYVVRFVNQIDLLNNIKKSWNKDNNDDEQEIIEKYKNCQILIIDEIGITEDKSWINDRFYSIINYRLENKKPLYYTSNSSIDEMNFDDRIVSRLRQMVEDVHYAEEDLRKMTAITGRRSNF